MKLLMLFFLLFNFHNIYSQIIPENRFKFLTNIGLEFERPQNYDHIIDVCTSPYFLTPNPEGDPYANYETLTQIIQDARTLSGWKVIYFSQGGTYRIGWTINLGPQDNKLIFKGAGSVLLHFKVGPQIQAHEFNIQGYHDGLPININETLIKGSKTINTTSAANFHVGDWVEIKNNWSTRPDLNKDWLKIGQISKIESIQGNTITLRDEFSLDYSNTYGTTIQKFIPAQNIGFEDLTIRRDGQDVCFVACDYGASNNFNFIYAVNCWVYGVDSWGTAAWHVGAVKSSNLFFHGNWFHHANGYESGEGYGITFSTRTSNCLVENNIFSHLRRSMVCQAGANRNVFSYNYSRDRHYNPVGWLYDLGDLSLHGSFASNNLFEGNIAECIYADHHHDYGINGLFNTFFRNYVLYDGDLGDAVFESSYYTNFVGNKCDGVNWGEPWVPSENYLDVYGTYGGGTITHNIYNIGPGAWDPIIYCSEISYYLSQKPTWLSSNYTWPPIGPRTSLSGNFLTQGIPAMQRYMAGGKVTLNGYPAYKAPIISSLVQTPQPLYKGSSGYVKCNLSQGNGTLNYQWSIVSPHSNFSISNTTSKNVMIHYNNTDKIDVLDKEERLGKNNFPIEGPNDAILRCSVWNVAGSHSKDVIVRLANKPPAYGCPFVYIWNGEEWIEDNNILPQSQDPVIFGQDVTDIYQLFTQPVMENERYHLAIGEFENERSYLDQLKLYIIDHPTETFIRMDDDGEILQFAKPAFFADAQLDSNQVLELLNRLDGINVELTDGDTLNLQFQDSPVYEPYLLIIGQAMAFAKDKITGRISKDNAESFTSFRLRRNPTFQWVLVPASGTDSLQVDILIEQESSIDYTELCRRMELPFTLYTPDLLLAEHTTLGNVTNRLNATDQNYVELVRDEMITLEFTAPDIEEGMERTFVFVSRGRYETDERLNKQNISGTYEEPVLPNETKLYENFPNPFNPITTIKYSLKNESKVTIKIYNSVGEEIEVLVNEFKPAGFYEIQFNASNLASGMYIYRMETADYTFSRKMLILK